MLVLHSYWRSSSAWRVRIALHLKGLPFTTKAVHLTKDGGEQFSEEFKQLNPFGQVPVLEIGNGRAISQSLAILEYLEESYPNNAPHILPSDPYQKAIARQLALMIVSGIQPLQNLKVLNSIAADFGPQHRDLWAKRVIDEGLTALESVLARTSGRFCIGDEITIADLCLIPQLYNARRFGVDVNKFHVALRIETECNKLEAFQKAHPDVQPDAPPKS